MLSVFSDNIDIIPGNVSWYGTSMGWFLPNSSLGGSLMQLNQILHAECLKLNIKYWINSLSIYFL